MIVLALILSFIVTAYAPNSVYSESLNRNDYSRLTNGDNKDSWGLETSPYLIACSLKYHGHIFVFERDIPGSDVRYCTDSVLGGAFNNRLDIAFVEGTNDKRIAQAKEYGRRGEYARVIEGNRFLECLGYERPDSRRALHEAVLALLSAGENKCLDI